MSQSTRCDQLSVYYHTHWDREWYLPFRAYQVRLAEVVDELLDQLEQGILPCFMLDGQTVVLDDYLELRPSNKARLEHLIGNGKLSIGPWFVMPDEFLVGGESLIRNLVRGIRESHAWGCHQFTGYLPDTFGHSADIPTILKNCGLDSAVIWRGVNPKQSLIHWKSPSGASVTTLHLTDGYFQMMLHDWTAQQTEQLAALDTLAEKLAAVSPHPEYILIPIGGDHLAPVSEQGHTLLKEHLPNLLETTPERHLASLRQITNGNLDTLTGELIDNTGSFLLPGVYSSRMYLKQANRHLEHLLVQKLEPLLAMTQALFPKKQLRYPAQELDIAWKTLLLNHPHDSICGCSVDTVHRENEVRFDHVTQLGEAMLNRAAQHVAGLLGTANDWVLFNTSEHPYTGLVEVTEDVPDADAVTFLTQIASKETMLQDEYLADTHRIPLSHLTKVRRKGWIWAEQLPPYAVTVMPKSKAKTAAPAKAVSVDMNHLENAFLTVQVNPDGTLSITDRISGKQYPNLLAFRDQPDQGDSYNSAPIPDKSHQVAEYTGIRILLKGPLVGSLELTHQLPALNMVLVTEVRLEAGSNLLKFQTRFINHAENHKLQVVFPTGKPVAEVAAESHLGIVTRQYDPNYRELEHMPAEKMKELKTNTGPIQRFISTNGQTWITAGLTEYEVYQDTLSLTLIRAFGYLSKADTGVRGAQAGPPFATPEGQCLNRHFCCDYSWMPTPSEPSALYHAADHFYDTIWGISGTANEGAQTQSLSSMVSWDRPELIASACYWIPGRGLALRLLNTHAESITIHLQTGFQYRSLEETNFLEESVKTLETSSVTVEALDVKTLIFAV